jgi:hypothetical protein
MSLKAPSSIFDNNLKISLMISNKQIHKHILYAKSGYVSERKFLILVAKFQKVNHLKMLFTSILSTSISNFFKNSCW